MTWPFSKSKTPAQERVGAGVDPKHAIEIVAHKDAAKEVVEQANAVNRQLKELLVENGFTVKIVLAMGGKRQIKGGEHNEH